MGVGSSLFLRVPAPPLLFPPDYCAVGPFSSFIFFQWSRYFFLTFPANFLIFSRPLCSQWCSSFPPNVELFSPSRTFVLVPPWSIPSLSVGSLFSFFRFPSMVDLLFLKSFPLSPLLNGLRLSLSLAYMSFAPPSLPSTPLSLFPPLFLRFF